MAARLSKPVNVVQPIGGGGGFWPPPVVFPQRQATTPDPGKSEICLYGGMNLHSHKRRIAQLFEKCENCSGCCSHCLLSRRVNKQTCLVLCVCHLTEREHSRRAMSDMIDALGPDSY